MNSNINCENIIDSFYCKDCFGCIYINNCENCNNCKWSNKCNNCVKCMRCYKCENCNNCVGIINMNNISGVFYNNVIGKYCKLKKKYEDCTLMYCTDDVIKYNRYYEYDVLNVDNNINCNECFCCVNCITSDKCRSCINCKNCNKCKECENCINCYNCVDCENLINENGLFYFDNKYYKLIELHKDYDIKGLTTYGKCNFIKSESVYEYTPQINDNDNEQKDLENMIERYEKD